MAGTYIFVFSIIPHKEDRFILPMLPFLFLILANFYSKLITSKDQKPK
jgi:hypothetical protein